MSRWVSCRLWLDARHGCCVGLRELTHHFHFIAQWLRDQERLADALERNAIQNRSCGPVADVGVTSMDSSDRRREFAQWVTPAIVPCHASLDKIRSRGQILGRDQNDHRRLGGLKHDLVEHLESLGMAGVDIDENDIGIQLPDQRDRFVVTVGLTKHLDILFTLKEYPQAIPRELMRLGDQNSDHVSPQRAFMPCGAAGENLRASGME